MRQLMATLLVCSLLWTASACRSSSTPPAPAPSTASTASLATRSALAQHTLDELVRAVRTQDRAAFDRTVSTRDPAFADRARILYGAGALPLAALTLRLDAPRQPLTGTRRNLLGAEAWSQRTTLNWRLVGESVAAQHTVWITFLPQDGQVRVAGTLDQPTSAVLPQPIWWTGPVTAASAGPLTVLTGAGQPAAVWLDRARSAAADVRRRVTGGAAARWTGAVVVEVPASRRDFEAVVGAADGSYATIAAVTLAEGPTPTSAVRVVVNPDVATTQSPLGLAVVLTHEVVHVATRSADTPAPTWAVEGLADYVAFDAYPAARQSAAAPVLRGVRDAGPPRSLPTDAAFRAGAPDLDLRYAEAWLACRYVAETWSPAALQKLYTVLDQGRTLDQASVAVLGVPATSLTAGWRRSLVRLAG